MQMKTKVTEQGVLVPKKFLKGIKEVEIRKNDSVILVVPVTEDPMVANRLRMRLPMPLNITTPTSTADECRVLGYRLWISTGVVE
jgi:hypothetical protein